MPMVPCFQCNPQGKPSGDPECAYCSGKGWFQTDENTAADMSSIRRPELLSVIPCSVALSDSRLCVIANDGTLWELLGSGWRRLPDLPQGDA